MKKLTKILLVLTALVLVFASCGENKTEVNQTGDLVAIVENSQSNYSIIRPREGSKLEANAAVGIRSAINESAGINLAIANDNMSEPAEMEILVGKTNRKESQDVYKQLKENEFAIKWVGKKLVIAGYDDKMMTRAYDYFINNFVSGKTTIALPEGYDNTYKLPTKEEQLAQNSLVAYPEYPERVQRDYNYSVTVKQGDKTITIPVYNEIRQVNNFGGAKGDRYRRFAEFSFSGDPVTISITVNQDMNSYLVGPSSKGYETKCEGNVISFDVKEPGQIYFKINGDNQSLLAIFADQVEIEEEIPSSMADDVIYYGPGWHDVPNDSLHVAANRTLYIAPGAVLNARVKLTGDNIKVMGRGMIRDPEDNRMDTNEQYVFSSWGGENLTIEDVKIVDGRSFSFVLIGGGKNVVADNIKVLTNQISTDGFSLFGAWDGITLQNSYLHVTDNIFVFGGVDQKNITVKDCIVGADYALVYPQSSMVDENVVFDGLDVFRMASFYKNTQYTAEQAVHKNILIQNVRAMDIDNEPILLYAQGQGGKEKSVTFKNIAIRNLTTDKAIRLNNGAKYTFNFDNVWIGDKLLTSFDGLDVVDNLTETTYNFADTNDKAAAFAGVRNEHEASYTAVKIKIGARILPGLSYPAYEQDGKAYIAIQDVLDLLGYETKLDGTTLSWDNKSATVEVKDGVAVAPHTFLGDNNIIGVNYDTATKTVAIETVINGANLITNPGFEEGFTPEWCTFAFSEIKVENKEVHSGENAIFVGLSNNAAGSAAGFAQHISDVIQMNGNGTYTLEAWVKRAPDSKSDTLYFGVVPSNWQVTGNDYGTYTLTDSWQKITYEFKVDNIEDYVQHHLYLGSTVELGSCFYVDDVSLVKTK